MDKSENAVNIFNKRARVYMEKYMYLDLYNDTFDIFCDAIKVRNAEVLELACGPGNITKYLLTKRPDLRILATDLAPQMLELAAANNPSATVQLLDCRDMAKLGKTYDAVMFGFGLPYLSKEEAIEWIGNAVNILKPGGILYISTMEDDYNKSGYQSSSSGDILFIHFHQADYLADTLTESGFNLIDLQRKDFRQPDGTITKDLVIVAKKPDI